MRIKDIDVAKSIIEIAISDLTNRSRIKLPSNYQRTVYQDLNQWIHDGCINQSEHRITMSDQGDFDDIVAVSFVNDGVGDISIDISDVEIRYYHDLHEIHINYYGKSKIDVIDHAEDTIRYKNARNGILALTHGILLYVEILGSLK
jgi:hypothetical protein